MVLCGLACIASEINPAWGVENDPDSSPPANPATAQELPNVVVIGTAPLPAWGCPSSKIPSNVQTAGSEDVKRQQSN